MSRINKHTIEFATRAYRHLHGVSEGLHWIAAWHEHDHNNPQWLQYAMFRRHGYYGEWALFEGGTYVASFDASFLASLMQAEDKAKAEREAARAAETQ